MARCYLRLGIRNGADGRTRIFCHICVHVHDNKACEKKFHHVRMYKGEGTIYEGIYGK
jgi:hypothetical protein